MVYCLALPAKKTFNQSNLFHFDFKYIENFLILKEVIFGSKLDNIRLKTESFGKKKLGKQLFLAKTFQ